MRSCCCCCRCHCCRSYILDAIDSSVDMVNDGIILLQEAAPNPKLFPKLQKLRVSNCVSCCYRQTRLACAACCLLPAVVPVL